ncbi:aminotransferase class V-fold PLP-dependent enzyme [Pelagibius sp. CAU 1746]|uniref:aminotransferase class V-fold PLP-dependent enzyme n=1 Tax=Pelagibius sp. CAU 1746 TaxID=3140370 RepID=UPI00325AB339
MSRILPAPKRDFIGLDGKVHLAAGGEPPLLTKHREAFEAFARDKARGYDGYWTHWKVDDEVRGQIARMMRLEAGDIALLGNASDGIMSVVSGFDWKPGDRVVAPELDYASGRYAFASLKRLGVEAAMVPARGWVLSEDDLLAACDERTRLVYASQVNALTGQHLDLEKLSAGLNGKGVALMVDASHAFGAVPLRGDLCDFLVTACYKFALGIHEGILGWNRRRQPDFMPGGAGWSSAEPGATPADYVMKPDARRFEYGNAGHLGAYLLRESLAYLESFGMEAIAAHNRALAEQLIAGLTRLGLEVMTPAGKANHAGNVCFVCPDPEAVMRRAAQDDILIWADNGRVRVSVHLFTTQEDVERFMDRLPIYLQ